MSDENGNVNAESGNVSPEIQEVNNDPDLKKGADRNWQDSWQKISAQNVVQQQQAALAKLREAVTELRMKGNPKQSEIDQLTRQYHDEISNIQPLTQEMVDGLAPAVSNRAWLSSMEDKYRAEMTAPEVRGKPAELAKIKEKFRRRGLPVDHRRSGFFYQRIWPRNG